MGRKLQIREYALGGNNVEAYYFEEEGLRAMAVEPGLEPERRRLWELVAQGLEHVPTATQRTIGCTDTRVQGVFFFGPSDERGRDGGADLLAVRAVSEVVGEMEPAWISAVEEARAIADSPRVMAAWSGVPIEAVLAALEDRPGPSKPEIPAIDQEEENMENLEGPPQLQPAGLEGFELWDRTVHAPAHQEVKVAFVSVRVGGVIGLNRAAYKMWGEPDACQVMFDPQRRRVALKPVGPEEENSYRLGGRGGDGIPCKALFDFYGVEVRQSRRYHDPKIVDGVLIVDL